MKLQQQNQPSASADLLACCDTLMLDMDGTLLDLAFDNYVWMEVVPREYAQRRQMPEQAAKKELYATMKKLRGTLEWYCLDFWSETLDLDIVAIHRDVNHLINFLPGAQDFLQHVHGKDLRLLLVTNSHRETLNLKNEVTDLTRFFDGIYTSHDLGSPKEEQLFWQSLQAHEHFDPSRTLFVDDNIEVLDSARRFGVAHLLAVSHPDSREEVRQIDGYASVDRVSRLITD